MADAVAHPPATTHRRRGLRARYRDLTAAEDIARERVSFAELAWAHERREEELRRDGQPGPCEAEYRRRLAIFQNEHGRLVEEYWCRHEVSGVALTEKQLPRRAWNFYRRDSILRMHSVTDWRTANATVIASYVHRWQTAAIKASEVLRDTSERIALHRIFAATTRLLAFLDRDQNASPLAWPDIAKVRAAQDRELADVDAYYIRAGNNSARIVYFRGMAWGTAFLAAGLGGSVGLTWLFGWVDPSDPPTYTLLVTLAMGAAGAILSVMTRMARADGFNLDFEVGRKSVRFLGGLRPWIGALFALALYIALKSSVIELLQGGTKTIYFYATIALLAGFSERRAKVLLDGAAGAAFGAEEPKSETPAPPAGQAVTSSRP